MSEGTKEVICAFACSVLLSMFSGKSLQPPILFLVFSYISLHKKLLSSHTTLYLLHVMSSCYIVAAAERGWEERIGWVISTCQGWHLGLNFTYESKKYSVIGKIITLVWLNYFYSFDMISPNLISLMPVIVFKYRGKEKDVENSDILITDSHSSGKCCGLTLPHIMKFVPINSAPSVLSMFYQSSANTYEFKNQRYQLVSLINKSKIHLSITPLDKIPI